MRIQRDDFTYNKCTMSEMSQANGDAGQRQRRNISENKNSYDLRGLISNFENDRIPAADFCKLFLTFLYNSLLHELCHNIGHCGFGKASPPRKFNSRITGSRSDQLKDQSSVELFGCYAVLARSCGIVWPCGRTPWRTCF